MGWGTIFTPEVYLNRFRIEKKIELDEHIKEAQRMVESCEKDLLMYASMDPKNLVEDKDYSDIVFSVKRRVEDTLEFYREQLDLLTKLYLLEDFFKEGGKTDIDE